MAGPAILTWLKASNSLFRKGLLRAGAKRRFEHCLCMCLCVDVSQEANFVEEVEDSPDFWSGPVQSYNSPVEYRFLIQLDWSTNGPLLDCDRKYVSVRTMPPAWADISC